MRKKSTSNKLLLPIAIGGGLLLLFLGMKKSNAQNQENTSNSDNTSAAEIPNENQTTPKYSDSSIDESSNQMDEPMDESTNTADDSINNQTNSDYSIDESNYTSPSPNKNSSTTGNKAAPKSNWTKPNQVHIAKIIKSKQLNQQNQIFNNRAVPNINAQTKHIKMQGKTTQNKFNALKNTSIAPRNFKPSTLRPTNAQSIITNKIFPLKYGQRNNYIKEVQKKIGVSPTGFFGAQTKAAIVKAYKSNEISELLYKQIITGKRPVVYPVNKTLKPARPSIKHINTKLK